MVAQPAVIIIETSKQLRLALLERLLPAPRINRGMGLFIIQTAVRAAVKRHQQQRPRLFGPDQRKNAPNGSEQLIEGFAVAQDGIGRKQHRIEFAAHHIAVQLEVGILLQDLRRQGPVGVCHPLGRVVAFQRFVESSREAVAVQARIWRLSAFSAITSYCPGSTQSSGTYMQFSTQTITSLRPPPG